MRFTAAGRMAGEVRPVSTVDIRNCAVQNTRCVRRRSEQVQISSLTCGTEAVSESAGAAESCASAVD